ncbi:hypothetical protein MMC08_005079 [Hypocenomyce scalaris]|nr:hypothetical protein [Hypocenomyce scalaris]
MLMKFDPNSKSLPKRADLPEIPGAPPGAAWFWGEDDEHGRLNLLTAERIKAASGLIKYGHVVPLNLPLDFPNPPLFNREKTEHTLKHLAPGAFDEVVSCNPQSGSQWDGFRHFAHPPTKIFYNNLREEEILGRTSTRCGAQAWAETGIVGRGVLLDVYSWAKESYDPLTTYSISASDLVECAKHQNTTFEPGDILVIRTGWVAAYNKLDEAGRQKLADIPFFGEQNYVGVEQSEEILDFLHDNYFAAAASDCICFEAWPPNKEKPMIHAYMLPLWGMPIGELWDTENLAEKCKKEGTYTFFFTSAPDNVAGSVGSRPNAMAIF